MDPVLPFEKKKFNQFPKINNFLLNNLSDPDVKPVFH